MILRNLSPNDVEEMRSIYLLYLDTGLPEERLRYLVKKHPAVCAVEDGQMIGFCYTNIFAPDIICIANIFVSEHYRNNGIGEKLLNSVLRQAKKEKFVSAILSNSVLYETKLEKKNPGKFYIKLGFEILYQTPNTIVYLKKFCDD
ncbi:MAG: hypothetical protein COB49_09045 [Alphaproteobacteria bacterium]|nr:MAG: hypothetical protein COB49_09045 [Alphaproteobacteria bacterium]